MNVAVLTRPSDPLSLRLYESNMIREIKSLGVEITLFQEEGPIPDACDLVWEPGLCMRRIPKILRTNHEPLVGTMHGVKAFSLPIRELATGWIDRLHLSWLKKALAHDWRWFQKKAVTVVAVSEYAAKEVTIAFHLSRNMVHVIYNGIDHQIFRPEGKVQHRRRPYFFHISGRNPIKNVERLFAAYAQLPESTRPDLVAVLPDYRRKIAINGIQLIQQTLSQSDLAMWYRSALCFVFPSLRETFGMPILEAMACGCPVVTSNSTGCAEVADQAALLVDPRSVGQIAQAMNRLMTDENLHKALCAKGLRRTEQFTWRSTARKMVQVFQSAIPMHRKNTMYMRKIEITTTTVCSNACQFCPHELFVRNYTKMLGPKFMEWKTFRVCIDKLPSTVGVSFGGMSEPFQNPLCTKMILYAKQQGHTIEIFTTLIGLPLQDLKMLMTELSLGNNPADDRLFIHLPSAGEIEHIPIDDQYVHMLRHLLESGRDIEYHYHGKQIHEKLRELPFNDKLKPWPLHNRAENETPFNKKTRRKRGRISCIMNLEVNFLLPNGDVLICCQDYLSRHVIGNLLQDSCEALYRSKEFVRIMNGLLDDKQDIMCRYCHFAVEEDFVE